MREYADLEDWCGHATVSLRTWQCADCGRAVSDATRRRLESAPTKAAPGSVWVLSGAHQQDCSGDEDADVPGGWVIGVFSDRAAIARLLIRQRVCDAANIRRVHWYRSVWNEAYFAGWEEGEDERGHARSYALYPEDIDRTH